MSRTPSAPVAVHTSSVCDMRSVQSSAGCAEAAQARQDPILAAEDVLWSTVRVPREHVQESPATMAPAPPVRPYASLKLPRGREARPFQHIALWRAIGEPIRRSRQRGQPCESTTFDNTSLILIVLEEAGSLIAAQNQWENGPGSSRNTSF
eukprot:7329882-Prymnesium_polylepis.1